MGKNRGGHITERQLRMLEMRCQGKTLTEIGDHFGITGEGVRINVNVCVRLISKHGLDALPDGCTTSFTADELCSIPRKKKSKPVVHANTTAAMTNDIKGRFIRINNKDFSFDELAEALGIHAKKGFEPFEVQLCQRVDAGILTATATDFGPAYPGIDVELHLLEKENTQPIMITRTEQPCEDEVADPVRTYSYGRNEDYFMYFDSDIRSDREVEVEAIPPSVVIAGDPGLSVDVWTENPYMNYKGHLPKPAWSLPHSQEKTMPEKIAYYRDNIAAQVTVLADGGYITPAQQAYLDKHLDEITEQYVVKCDAWEVANGHLAPLDVEMDIIHKEILTAADQAPRSLDAQIADAAERSCTDKSIADVPVKAQER